MKLTVRKSANQLKCNISLSQTNEYGQIKCEVRKLK